MSRSALITEITSFKVYLISILLVQIMAYKLINQVTGFVRVAAQSTGRRRRQANPADTRAKAEYELDATAPKDASPDDVADATEDAVKDATDDGFDALDSDSFDTIENTGSLPAGR